MLNNVELIGRLGRDPESKESRFGDFVTFGLATSEYWRDKNTGEKREKTQWHNVVIFNEHIAKVASQYCHKGDLVYIQGALEHREYEKDGEKRYATEVVVKQFTGKLIMLGSKGAARNDDFEADPPAGGSTVPKGRPGAKRAGQSPRTTIEDDEIPF